MREFDFYAQDAKDAAQDKRIRALSAEVKSLAESERASLVVMGELLARIEVLELLNPMAKHPDFMAEFRKQAAEAEAANAPQAESSPGVPYMVSVEPFEPDDIFDTRLGRPC